MSTNLGKIGPFEVVRLLAKGGMGEVFLVKDPSCARLIALKKIRDDLRKHKTMQVRFFREAKIAARLTHPSIMPIYMISEDPQNAYYTMPYIEGETLKEILLTTLRQEKKGEESRHPLGSSVPALVRVFLSVCQAVAYAHSKGILHRDLKTDNVIVGKFGEVMILDWGIAVDLEKNHEELPEVEISHDSLTHPGKIPGTLSHLAPERAQGERASFLSEVYALGVLLYQLLTLRLPFQRTSLEEFRKTGSLEEFVSPDKVSPYRDIPPQLSMITQRCLSAKKEERYESVQELIDELQNYIEGKPEWIPSAELSLSKKQDWEFQENILLTKHLAIARTPEAMEWVNLMFSQASFPGNIRIETKVFVRPGGKGVGILLGIPETSERIGLADGYSLWISAEEMRDSKLFRSSIEVMPIDCALTPEVWHVLSIEKLDNHLRFYLNGRLRCHYISHRPLAGTHVGLLFRDAEFQMEPLKIFLGSQSVQVNCLAVPDAFLASRLYAKALNEYRRIGYSFPGRAEGREALFRAGITLLEQALNERKKQRRQQLFSLALEEFGKLRGAPGAPLEYLGKSLVYKAWNDVEDEVKCLELALRKYPKHPLLPILTEEIRFRLHESSAQNRKAGLLFALLVLRQLPHLFSSQETKQLLESLQKSLEPVSFLDRRGEKIDPILHLSIELAFWLEKPITLLEILEQEKEPLFTRNILFSLLHLGCFEMVKDSFPQAENQLLLEAEKKPLAALKTALQKQPDIPLLSFLIQRLIDKGESASLLPYVDELLPLLPELSLRILLLEKKWEKAGEIFSTRFGELCTEPHSPVFVLYGCFLRAQEGELAALTLFSSALDASHPRLSMLLSYYLQEMIQIDSLLHWEKVSLFRDLVLYARCAGSSQEAVWQKRVRQELKRNAER